MSKRYMITSALPYANGPAHIGHIAGAYLPADIYVRYLRSKGEDVVWVCGSDEHGAAITLRAKKEGITPQEIVDKYHTIIKGAMSDFGISFDIYSRTSSEKHKETAQDFFKVLNDKGCFEVKTTEQYYDEAENQFLADRYITGRCPNCDSEGAYGDQCEKCGKDLSPTDLIDPKSTISGNSPILKETSLWYLPMGNHEEWLKDYIYNGNLDGKTHHNPKEWKNHVVGQCKSWLEEGLHSRAMTRDLDWGIPVPVEGAEGKVLYVWMDAPIGYITATKEWAEKNNKNWEDYWKDSDTELIHFIGKDNIVFHSIIFPIILKEHGGYNLPTNVPANEFMNLEGDKISTSRNWAVWLHEYLEEFPDKKDELRYVLTSIMPEQKDSEFTWEEYQKRINNELADVVGNFYNRAFVLTNKYYDGVLPSKGELSEIDKETLALLAEAPNKIGQSIEKFRFKEALSEMMSLARLGNKYLADNEPWRLVKTDPERVKTIMNITIQIAANLAFAMEPFLPFTAKKVQDTISLDSVKWNELGGVLLEDGSKIEKLPILFSKIEDKEVEDQKAKLEASKVKEVEVAPAKENIEFEDFTKLDIRVGVVLEAERIKKTKKLIKLLVDVGIDKRTIVSGIAEHYSPEDVIGKKVSVIVNLAPRKLRGVESQGMILMSENSEGELSFVSSEKENSKPGDGVN